MTVAYWVKRGAAVLALITAAAPLQATAPEVSLRPSLRPAPVSVPTPAPVQDPVQQAMVQLPTATDLTGDGPRGAGLRPALRPVSAQILAAANLPVTEPGDMSAALLDQSLRPALRPDTIVEQALFKRRRLRKGSVCGDIDIQGTVVGSVVAKLPGCGAKNAVRVKSIAGVTLSQESVMTCETAEALKHWISKDVEKAFGRRNRVVSLRVAAHYACRTRNNRPGAKISEHGRGKAIDISGFKLEDGTVVTVLDGWKSRKTRKKLAKIWKAACGPFGTVLGPEADRHHRDHFHLDVARHRGGAYCR